MILGVRRVREQYAYVQVVHFLSSQNSPVGRNHVVSSALTPTTTTTVTTIGAYLLDRVEVQC